MASNSSRFSQTGDDKLEPIFIENYGISFPKKWEPMMFLPNLIITLLAPSD